MRTRLVTLVLAALLVACRDTETYTDRQPPVMLIDLPSYASEREIVELLPATGIKTLVRYGPEAGDTRPPFNIVVLSAANYSHLGFAGELRLEFFNDRLMSVWFFPLKYQEYLAELRRTGTSVGHIFSDPGNRNPTILTHRDRDGQPYVAWEDRRLLEQQRRWIERHS